MKGRRKLAKVDGNLNSENYISLLRTYRLPDFKDGEIYTTLATHQVQHKCFLCMKTLNFWKTGLHKVLMLI